MSGTGESSAPFCYPTGPNKYCRRTPSFSVAGHVTCCSSHLPFWVNRYVDFHPDGVPVRPLEADRG